MKRKTFFRDLVGALLIAFTIAMLLRIFIAQAYIVSSGSMENTVMTGDFVFVNKLTNWFTDPKANDIIVFEYPQNPTKDYIKRIVATPGQTVEVRNKQLFVDGNIVPDFSGMFHGDSTTLLASNSSRDFYGPVTLPPDSFFVMGDNRDDSQDSRFWGFLGRDRIKGKLLFVYLSLRPDDPPSGLVPLVWYKVSHFWERIRWERLFTSP